MKRDISLYKQLFKSTFMLSAFTFGGGYVIISLMQKKFVEDLKWLSEEEMLNLTAIAQSSPGPVAVNASILVGFKIAGPLGALAAIIGTILPPLIIISIISMFYNAFRQNVVVNAVLQGMQAGVAAVIADVVFNMGGKVCAKKEIISTLVMILAFIATYFIGINVAIIILVAGVVGAIRVSILAGKENKQI